MNNYDGKSCSGSLVQRLCKIWCESLFSWFQNGDRRHLEFISGVYFCHLVVFG